MPCPETTPDALTPIKSQLLLQFLYANHCNIINKPIKEVEVPVVIAICASVHVQTTSS